MSLPFLLEVGVEEIPDWMIPAALEGLRGLFLDVLSANKLTHSSLRLDATPRRLVLRAEGLPDQQTDSEELVTGPPKAAAEAAVAGFARKQGIAVETLSLQTTPKGQFYGYVKKVAGRATSDILAQALPDLILKIHFPKTMYWTGKTGPRFIRPIRWIVALLGDEVVPFEIAAVKSGCTTSGHRRIGASDIPVTIESYERLLRENGVILSADERRAKIQSEIAGFNVRPDPSLLETLVYITEYPTAIRGDFDPAFLSLPEEVLITVMKHHQKNFSVVDASGKLAPHFVAVMNTNADPEGLVRRGNERVLRARFNDARFFWDTDQHKKLEDRVADLANVTFQAKLGSYLAKTERMVELAKQLGGDSYAARAARLSKCDLTTELVKEFTELQGVIGGLYARAQGEPDEVATAIYDHYKPVSMEDSIPRTRAGQLVSIADKLDTLCGCFGIGMIPSGSRDPFALRRAAQGIVKILAESGLQIPLQNDDEELNKFLEDRVRYYYREVRGYPYDEVNAAMAKGWSEIWDLEKRLEALHQVRPTPDFEPLAASFKRIKNILEQAKFDTGAVEAAALAEAEERDLYQAMTTRNLTGVYHDDLLKIASLRPAVDRFFDKVLVNAPDPKLRANRLALLSQLRNNFTRIADFSEIITNS